MRASRGFRYHYEPAEVKILILLVLILLDAPGLFSFVLALLLVPLSFILPPMGDYDFSWSSNEEPAPLRGQLGERILLVGVNGLVVEIEETR